MATEKFIRDIDEKYDPKNKVKNKLTEAFDFFSSDSSGITANLYQEKIEKLKEANLSKQVEAHKERIAA